MFKVGDFVYSKICRAVTGRIIELKDNNLATIIVGEYLFVVDLNKWEVVDNGHKI